MVRHGDEVEDAARSVRGGRATGGRNLTPRGLRSRAVLTDAAARVFAELPFAEARLSDITNGAGMSAGSFYTYFDTKEQIFREVANAVLDALGSSVDHLRWPSTDTAERPIDAVAAATRTYFVRCIHHRQVMRSMEQLALSDDDLAADRRAAVITGVRVVQRFIEALQVDDRCDGSVDSWDVALVLHTLTVRVAYDHLLLDGHADDLESMIAALCQVWQRTLELR